MTKPRRISTRRCFTCMTYKSVQNFEEGKNICDICRTHAPKDDSAKRECLGLNCEPKPKKQRLFDSKSRFNKMCPSCIGTSAMYF